MSTAHADFAFVSEARTEAELRETAVLTECRLSGIVDLRGGRVVDADGLLTD